MTTATETQPPANAEADSSPRCAVATGSARLEMAEHCLAEIRALMPEKWDGMELVWCVIQLKKDAERLDWLDKNRPWVHNAASGYTESFGAKGPYWGLAPKNTNTIYGETMREAIDAAKDSQNTTAQPRPTGGVK